MTISRNTLAHIRYGYGFRPDSPYIDGAAGLIAQVRNDKVPPLRIDLNDRRDMFEVYKDALRKQKDNQISMQDMKDVKAGMVQLVASEFRASLQRCVVTHNGFAERLTSFWTDHFTVSARGRRLSLMRDEFVHQAIRPHIGGSFVDMLIASTTHPAMLVYLDQNTSIGPNSVVGKEKSRGLNENLAREILELHTLGVGSGYAQNDVREFAELLTGLRLTPRGVRFGVEFAEPGPETVLDVEYGADRDEPGLETIKTVLRDLALRPETAQHLARKLAVHFVEDTPEEDLVASVADAYLQSSGDLAQTYEALLAHEAAWVPELRKVKQPWDYVVSALRVFGFDAGFFATLTDKDVRQGIVAPMTEMGQVPNRPLGPDGWPEEAAAWITPATLAARIEWVTELARKYGQDIDPRPFLETALGDARSQNTSFLVAGSESKWEGVALALASPEFNRR